MNNTIENNNNTFLLDIGLAIVHNWFSEWICVFVCPISKTVGCLLFAT